MREDICHTPNKNWEKYFKLGFRVYSLGLRLNNAKCRAWGVIKTVLSRCSEFWVMTARDLAFSRLGRWSGGCSLYLWILLALRAPHSALFIHSYSSLPLSLSSFFFFFWLKFFQLEQTLIFWRHLFPERGGIRFLRHFLNTPVDIIWKFNSVPTHNGHGVPACLSHSPEKSLHSQGPSKLTQSY